MGHSGSGFSTAQEPIVGSEKMEVALEVVGIAELEELRREVMQIAELVELRREEVDIAEVEGPGGVGGWAGSR